MKTFLESNGYRQYKTTETSTHYQKRIDTDKYPMCNLNDKLFINVTHHKIPISKTIYESFEINLCQENQDGDWCDLKIFSLPEEKLVNLAHYETKLLEMWNVFYQPD